MLNACVTGKCGCVGKLRGETRIFADDVHARRPQTIWDEGGTRGSHERWAISICKKTCKVLLSLALVLTPTLSLLPCPNPHCYPNSLLPFVLTLTLTLSLVLGLALTLVLYPAAVDATPCPCSNPHPRSPFACPCPNLHPCPVRMMSGGETRGAIVNTRIRATCIVPRCCGRSVRQSGRALLDEYQREISSYTRRSAIPDYRSFTF